MPHLVILYTGNLDAEVDMPTVCRTLADTMATCRDEQDKPVFPIGGIRVLAYPSAHHAVADGRGDFGFIYLNLRMARGRSDSVKRAVGEALAAAAKTALAPLLARRPVGVTFQIDEGAEVFDAKIGNLHAHFATARP